MRTRNTERRTRNGSLTNAHRRSFRVPCSVFRVALPVLLVLFAPVIASACPVCYGPADEPMVKGTNNGVWVLLGVIGFVQLGFVALFWSFWRRAREQQRFRESFHVIEGGPHP